MRFKSKTGKPPKPKSGEISPLKAIRLNCLDCNSTNKGVRYCSMDGFHSTKCHLWPFRFGKRPQTARKLYGDKFLTPSDMPEADELLEDLP